MPVFILDNVSVKTAPYIYPDEDLPVFPARTHYILGGCMYCWRKALKLNPLSVAAGVLAERIWHYVTEIIPASASAESAESVAVTEDRLKLIRYGLDVGNYELVNNTIIDIIDEHPTPRYVRSWYSGTVRTGRIWSIV
jgi:hypothetical protein